VGGVGVAAAQAMRCAGCPNRRSLGVSEVIPPGMPYSVYAWRASPFSHLLPLPPPRFCFAAFPFFGLGHFWGCMRCTH
jgi:hypothetical protein